MSNSTPNPQSLIAEARALAKHGMVMDPRKVVELADALEAATTRVQREWERAQKAETALCSDAERRRVIDHASMLVGLEAQRAEAAEKERDEARAALFSLHRGVAKFGDWDLGTPIGDAMARARAALGEEKSG